MHDHAEFVADIQSGDHRKALEAMRDKLAVAMNEADTNVIAQVSARLQAVLSAIAELPTDKKGSPILELIRTREDRRSAAKAGASAARSG